MYISEQMLEKHLKTCHFLPLFSRTDEMASCPTTIGKSFSERQIGREA
jgi:hypothetical protein